MINGDLTELIRQAEKEKTTFLELLTPGKSKSLNGDIYAIRSLEVNQAAKLEALERLAENYFSFAKVFHRARQAKIFNRINEQIKDGQNWGQAWKDLIIPELFILLNSEEVSNNRAYKHFELIRRRLRGILETGLLGQTQDSKPVYFQEYNDERGLYEGGKKLSTPAPFNIIIDRKTGNITHTGEALQVIPYKPFYTGHGLEDDLLKNEIREKDLALVEKVIKAVGREHTDFYVLTDRIYFPDKDNDGQPIYPVPKIPQEKRNQIDTKRARIKKKMQAAAALTPEYQYLIDFYVHKPKRKTTDFRKLTGNI